MTVVIFLVNVLLNFVVVSFRLDLARVNVFTAFSTYILLDFKILVVLAILLVKRCFSMIFAFVKTFKRFLSIFVVEIVIESEAVKTLNAFRLFSKNI